jgi:DNA-binding CsgD family transcriptional regulator
MDCLALSQREREVAALVSTGASNKEIARQLDLSTKTIKNVLTKVFVKTGTRSRTELAVHLVRREYAADPIGSLGEMIPSMVSARQAQMNTSPHHSLCSTSITD